MAAVNWIPEGYHRLTPNLVVSDAAKAIEFYQQALGAEETVRMPGPGGKILHAELRIGDSVFMLGEEGPEFGTTSPKTIGGSGVSFYLYNENVDAAFERAVKAGATPSSAPETMFWGDRVARLQDPFGHLWTLSQHVADPTPEEIEKGQQAFFAGARGT